MNLVFATGVLFPQNIGPVFEYFNGLRKLDPNALFPNVSGLGSVKERAQQLANAIRERNFPDGPIHIIAHSMGGLDARHFLVKGPKELTTRVASLSTIGTPHRGSLIADLIAGKIATGWFDFFRTRAVKFAIRLLLPPGNNALDDLTTESAERFNREFLDVDTVRYFSYAGHSASKFLTPTHDFITEHGKTEDEQTNDGVVSVASAEWPTKLTEPSWDADHFLLIGHNLGLDSKFNHVQAIGQVVRNATGQIWP